MARKDYPDEFKGDAVALCRDTDGATITQIAAELGVSETTLSAWCKAAGVAIRHRKPGPANVPTAGVETPSKIWSGYAPRSGSCGPSRGLATERDVLRSAAKYFARETNW
jgi:transposase